MNYLITICARGGSKGIPGKNIRILNGKPLIAYSIQTASQFKSSFGGTDIVLSTDSEEIRRKAADFGVDSDYERPAHLATDSAGKIGAIADVLKYQEEKINGRYDFIIDLDVTSPLRTFEDLQNALALMKENETALNLFSVSPAHRNPYFNMVERKENGFYGLIKKPENGILTRQSAPKAYDLNASFYIYRRAFFDGGYQTVFTDRSLVYEVPHLCFDLDEPVDFEFLEFLMVNRKLQFEI